MTKKDYLRMASWLLLAAIFYALSLSIEVPPTGGKMAQIQTGLWKAGHVTSGAYIGYWIYRHRFGRLTSDSAAAHTIAAAIVMAAAIVGMAFGL